MALTLTVKFWPGFGGSGETSIDWIWMGSVGRPGQKRHLLSLFAIKTFMEAWNDRNQHNPSFQWCELRCHPAAKIAVGSMGLPELGSPGRQWLKSEETDEALLWKKSKLTKVTANCNFTRQFHVTSSTALVHCLRPTLPYNLSVRPTATGWYPILYRSFISCFWFVGDSTTYTRFYSFLASGYY